MNDGVDVVRVGADAILETWPTVGPAIVEAGYSSVYALPLVVQGRPIGGLNVFTAHGVTWDDEQRQLARTFADIVTLAVVQSSPRDQDDLTARVHHVLEGRVVAEQAKGVLAYDEDLEMGDAYEHLLDLAHREGITMTAAARAVIDGAARRRSST
ncbi:GAF and ANTAR domain-containing protein [Sanguibacter suaedae]|uniref:GAF and ANTAR domain-containing protein n=1 Tax=Sanguibacter suaedae TaxID=2795737 RepID=A0A934I6G4_9MICO|nr:GAF and ANTAR domain-containing protein [Sanguibacter suaedae]MBI9116178.1 GAF and ANTAR domain-containing protein [Sanguibacter suaedae]